MKFLLDAIDAGEIRELSLHGPGGERFWVLGKPGCYYVNLFIDESQGYGFNDGTGDRSGIDIGGDYWASFRVCRGKPTVLAALHDFYWSGGPPKSKGWFHYSDE